MPVSTDLRFGGVFFFFGFGGFGTPQIEQVHSLRATSLNWRHFDEMGVEDAVLAAEDADDPRTHRAMNLAGRNRRSGNLGGYGTGSDFLDR